MKSGPDCVLDDAAQSLISAFWSFRFMAGIPSEECPDHDNPQPTLTHSVHGKDGNFTHNCNVLKII